MAKPKVDEAKPAGRADEWIRVTGPIEGREVAGLKFATPGRILCLFDLDATQLAAIQAEPGLVVERIEIVRPAA